MASPYLGGYSHSYHIPLLLIFISIITCVSILILTRLSTVLLRSRPTSLSPTRPPASSTYPTHLLVVLGSGGHTAEMLNMLRHLPCFPAKFTYRTYVVSSGDGFSALKAREFEMEMTESYGGCARPNANRLGREVPDESYSIVTVRRARRVHQSLFSTPWSTTLCLWDCLKTLTGTRSYQFRSQRSCGLWKPTYPDLIITNGPGTGVCVVFASLILLLFGFHGHSSPLLDDHVNDSNYKTLQWQHSGQMRTVLWNPGLGSER